MIRPYELDDDLRSLLPALTAEESAGLCERLAAEGQRDALVCGRYPDGTTVLLDGYNRHTLLTGLGLHPRVTTLEIPDKTAAIEWIVSNQMARRNLTDEQRSYFIGKEYLSKKKARGGKRVPKSKSQDATLPMPSTAEQVGERHGVDRATVHRAAEFAAAVDAIGEADGPEAKREVLAGTSGRTKKEIVEEAKPEPKKPRNPKPPAFLWPAAHAKMGTVVRCLVDDLKNNVPGVEALKSYKALVEHLDEAVKALLLVEKWCAKKGEDK